jgi:hypothetical integral membrane protein (TIGR02206 family)
VNPPAPPQVYEPYGASHWSMLVLTVIGAVLLVLLGRRHRNGPAAERFSRVFGVTLWAVAAGCLLWNLLPGNFDLQSSIPLHLSDVLRFVSGYALITKARWALAISYYWALTLNPQAMLTPSLVYTTIPAVDFFAYWAQHILVMWAAIYLVWGLGKRPDWRSYRAAILITVFWAAATFLINSALGTNYGYLNRKPSSSSLLDVLGDWPSYLISEFVAVAVVWALITVPWMIKRPTGTPASPG